MIYICLVMLAAIVAAIIIRMLYKKSKENKKQKDLAKTYDRLVRENKLSIEETHVSNNRLIGLDRKNKKLLLIDHNTNIKQEQCVALDHLDSCEIIREKDEAKKCTIRFFLELKYKRSNGKLKFIFFDESEDKIVEKPSLTKRAEYWRRKINLYMKRDKINRTFEYVI
jgi:uncharacterized protein YpmB